MNAAELQVAVGSLRGIAEEMGTALIHSALSPNIKERRDCSTALFDAAGRLVIQAEHIPVHLGALPASVAAVRARDVAPGEVWVLNDPFLGGSHLPDITLVSPIHVDGELLGWAASRAHHADVGGMVPASMPADSTELHQEGLILPPMPLTGELIDLIAANSRAGDERRGDLRAQLAVHRLAERRVGELCARRGADWWRAACAEVWDYAERRTRAAIAADAGRALRGRPRRSRRPRATWRSARRSRSTATRCGSTSPARRRSTAGTSTARSPSPCRRAASCCAWSPIPTRPPPAAPTRRSPSRHRRARWSTRGRPAAVVAGNVETSSRIADCLLRAFGKAVDAPAQGQGTMNNLTFGSVALHVLRDDRRRPGRLGRRPGPVGRARGDVEHAQHPGRGARGRVPAARRAVRAARRQRRRRAAIRAATG